MSQSSFNVALQQSNLEIRKSVYLISGYHKNLSKNSNNFTNIVIVPIEQLIYKYYFDNYHFVWNGEESNLLFYASKRIAFVSTSDEEYFQPFICIFNHPISTHCCNKMKITLKWSIYTGGESIILAYFYGKNLQNIKKMVQEYNSGKLEPLISPQNGFEPVVGKCFLSNNYMINFTKKEQIKCNDTPRSATSTWEILLNFKHNLMQISHETLEITTLNLRKDISYILPVFILLTEKGGDWLQIVKVAIM